MHILILKKIMHKCTYDKYDGMMDVDSNSKLRNILRKNIQFVGQIVKKKCKSNDKKWAKFSVSKETEVQKKEFFWVQKITAEIKKSMGKKRANFIKTEKEKKAKKPFVPPPRPLPK